MVGSVSTKQTSSIGISLCESNQTVIASSRNSKTNLRTFVYFRKVKFLEISSNIWSLILGRSQQSATLQSSRSLSISYGYAFILLLVVSSIYSNQFIRYPSCSPSTFSRKIPSSCLATRVALYSSTIAYYSSLLMYNFLQSYSKIFCSSSSVSEGSFSFSIRSSSARLLSSSIF